LEEPKVPKLLVITPVFNGEKYIEETIISVLNAQIPSMEYLIVNDGSTDGTSKILDKFAGRIDIIHQPNSGEGNAVNVGFSAVDSEYVMIVSADDLVSKNIFRKLTQTLDENPQLSVVYPDWEMIDSAGKTLTKVNTMEFSKTMLFEKMICLPGPGTMIRRSSVKRDFLRDDSYIYIGDFECWLYLARESDFMRVPENLAKWRSHGKNMSITGRNSKMAGEFIRVYKEMSLETKSSSALKQLTRKGLGTAYFFAARLVYFDRSIPAKRYLIKSLYLNFFLKRDIFSVGYIISGRAFRRIFTPLVSKLFQRKLSVD
jgi:glycosyltransferase involved in cell wall biosynthesis